MFVLLCFMLTYFVNVLDICYQPREEGLDYNDIKVCNIIILNPS